MQFLEVLKRCQGQRVIVNNTDERELLEVQSDFIVLRGGNPQMRLTEFIPLGQIVSLSRAEYSGGQSSVYLDIHLSAGEEHRSGDH
jgi:hypothetical protein